MLQKLIKVCKSETVLVIAFLLAVVSSFVNPPSKQYLEFIDFRVLGLLLSLMLVMAGLQKNKVFFKLGEKLIQKCSSIRALAAVLVFLCFFSSMVLTNDVALITFVPFALLTLRMADMEQFLIPIVTAQTIAANLGSMLTPMGNPQNLYLYGLSGLSMGGFVALMLPYAGLAAVLLLLCVVLLKKEKMELPEFEDEIRIEKLPHVIMYILLFGVCIMCVLHVFEWQIVLLTVALAVFIMDHKVLKMADYGLLLTFICFFIFIGNMGEIPAVKEMLATMIDGRECAVAVVASQVISNVPAAILLSGFTTDYTALIIGTNLGGLGTLIASMASLISYKQLVNAYPERKSGYFRYFTVLNVLFLILLWGLYLLIG